MPEGGGEVGFAESDAAKKDEVLFFFDEVEGEGVLDLLAVDGAGPVPVELVEGFQEGEAGGFDAPFDGAGASLEGFSFDEAGEGFDVGAMLFCGFLDFALVVVADPCEFEVGEVFLEGLGFGFHGLGSFSGVV